MSSHHIVRENQEPALIVDTVGDLSEEYMGQLLEWSPTIFVGESSLAYFLLNDIKVDFLVGRLEETVASAQDIKTVSLTNGVVIDALEYLSKKDYKAVNIIASALPKGIEEYCSQINIAFFTAQRKYVYVREKYEKWQVKGLKVYVDQAVVASSKGLRIVGDNIYETIGEGFFSLRFTGDNYVAVGEEL